MAGETIITIVGNITADPELRYTQNWVPVVNFTIASTPRVFDKQTGQTKDGDPLFLRCTAWRELGGHIAGSLTKGTRVIAQGRLVQRSFQDREGNQRSTIELEVDAIGPDLRWATVQVTRAARPDGGQAGRGRTETATDAGWEATPSADAQTDVWGAVDDIPF